MQGIRYYFEILDITPDASYEDAKTAYRDLMNVWHPDKHGQNERLLAKATEKTKVINDAWDRLQLFYKTSTTTPESTVQSTATATNTPTVADIQKNKETFFAEYQNQISSFIDAVKVGKTPILIANIEARDFFFQIFKASDTEICCEVSIPGFPDKDYYLTGKDGILKKLGWNIPDGYGYDICFTYKLKISDIQLLTAMNEQFASILTNVYDWSFETKVTFEMQ